jgi:hypothetical protein
MSAATTDEIIEHCREPQNGGHRVERQGRAIFRGVPGHHYVVPARTFSRHILRVAPLLARITHNSRDDRGRVPEVALVKVNSTYIVSIGIRGVAAMDVLVFPRNEAFREYRWIAHTHPLELENEYEHVLRNSSRRDDSALTRICDTWDQQSSWVVVCQGGRVMGDLVEFRMSPFDPCVLGTFRVQP